MQPITSRIYEALNFGFSIINHLFQDLDLDCSIELTQAPGLSAYNRAERKMYHLSKELSGVILPAETYGTHLRNGVTVDEELEERNFQGTHL